MLSLFFRQTLQEVFFSLFRFSRPFCFRISLWSYLNLRWFCTTSYYLLLFLFKVSTTLCCEVYSFDDVSMLRGNSGVVGKDLSASYVASWASNRYRTIFACRNIARIIIDRVRLRYVLHWQSLLRALRNCTLVFNFRVFDGHRLINSLIHAFCIL